MDSFPKSLLTSKLPPKSLLQAQGSKRTSRIPRGKIDYSPVPWSKYFSEKRDIKINNDSFRIYTLGNSGPCLVLIHGGGFSALSWAVLSGIIVEMVECQILAIDLRGHGDTSTSSDDSLSIDTLANDVVSVINAVYPECPPIVLIGHSLGGSVAVHAGHHQDLPSLIGIVVIDVVEGTALGALASMQSILRGRPQTFNSIEDAIRWSVQSGQLKNLDSAKVSMPGQIKNLVTNQLSTAEVECYIPAGLSAEKPIKPAETISESEEAHFKPPGIVSGNYGWRIDLRRTEQHWTGWFEGLSKLFLTCQAQKLLLLASLDRLDTDLTVAQMQGKFEVHAFEQSRGRCGHAVHEDIPDAVAEVIATYLIRNKFAVQKSEVDSILDSMTNLQVSKIEF